MNLNPDTPYVVIPDYLEFLGVNDAGVALFKYSEVKGSRIGDPTVSTLTDNQAVLVDQLITSGQPVTFTTTDADFLDLLEELVPPGTPTAIADFELFGYTLKP